MSYFNHAYKKVFVATKDTIAESGGFDAGSDGMTGVSGENAGIEAGVLTSVGVHVSMLKSEAAAEGFQLGPGVIGMFDAKTHLSVTDQEIDDDCCPFYLAGASIKLNDKQGPFHGGYQESNKSKIINPKYIRKLWKAEGTAASRAVVEVGGTVYNTGGVGNVASLDDTSLVPGTGYTGASGVATTGGTGTGLTVDTTDDGGGGIDSVVIADAGSGYTVGDVITITGGNADATIEVLTIEAEGCISEFLCGETYYLRVDVKGTPALRALSHNLYHDFDASGGCCDNPSIPVAVDPVVIYKQWATQMAEEPIWQDFVRPLLLVDGQAYAYDAAAAVAEGLDPATELFEHAPTTSSTAGLLILGAYVDTAFADCTFQPTDYYGVEPIQILASEVDLNGDPCTFAGVCVSERCPGVQANGLGETKVRELLLSEGYIQNFTATDLRIREITQGTRIYEVLSRTSLYSSFYLLHSVPRYNNPTGTFDNDQYLLEIVGSDATLDYLQAQLEAIAAAGCLNCQPIEDYTGTTCAHTVPNP